MRTLMLLVAIGSGTTVQADPLHHWAFTKDHIAEGTLKATAGGSQGTINFPVQFAPDGPQALLLPGDSKAKHRIEVSANLAQAKLPVEACTVEAWVRIDRVQDWGAFIGAFQDNGAYEKGWLLGFEKNRFVFAVASKGSTKLTYLHSALHFQPKSWYYVVGVYTGKEMMLYVDGELQGKASDQKGAIDYPPKGWLTLAAYHDDNECYPMAGQIESVAVHEQALTSDAIKRTFAARKKHFPGIEGTRPQVTDWPTYNRDDRRTGMAEEALTFPLQPRWQHREKVPSPAWPEEAQADYYHNKFDLAERVTFDRVNHVVGVDGHLFFGSSTENVVRCLDADTGRVRWSFPTEGPVRLAPTVAADRVLFGCDDGFVYCVTAKDGTLLWKQRIAPEERRIPGNGRIISAWPVRTDVLVQDGKAYVCAGVFPSWGVYQVTLNVADGKELQRQTLKITAQGYLERLFGKLMVTTGRNPAGAFVADLKSSGKDVTRTANLLAKDYPHAFIGAGNMRIAGGDGRVAAFDATTGDVKWSAPVEGKAYALAVVRGRLIVSTDTGHVYCFTADAGPKLEPSLPPIGGPNAQASAFAQEIVRQARMERGYVLLLGADHVATALALHSRTAWQIVVVDPDAARVRAGLHDVLQAGAADRVSVQQGSLAALPYSDYTFNIVVDHTGKNRAEALRVTRPHGGWTIFDRTFNDAPRRPKLEGEGTWTHMYGDVGNTSCSNDTLVGDALQLQWFGKPGPRGMVDRHHRTVSPVARDGRIVVPGQDQLTAVDIYNGTILWEKTIPQTRRVTAFRDSSYLALGDDALFVATPQACLELDPATGKESRRFALPMLENGPHEWAFTATVGEWLIGSATPLGAIRREQNHKNTLTETHWDNVPAVGSTALFGYDRSTAKHLWTYHATQGLIVNPSLVLDSKHAYFIESTNPATLKSGRAKYVDLVGQGSRLCCLDLKTGKLVWTQPGKAFERIQHNVFTVLGHDRLAIVGSRNSGPNKKVDTVWYDIHVFDAATGKAVWSKSQDQKDKIGGEHGEQERHPTLVGKKLFCEPYAYDMLTGTPIEWQWPWANGKTRRGCGTFSASASCLFYRDDTAKSYNLDAGSPKTVTAETRPGCWINFLPVGGLVVAPEASSGCTCNYSVQTSLALIPIKKR